MTKFEAIQYFLDSVKWNSAESCAIIRDILEDKEPIDKTVLEGLILLQNKEDAKWDDEEDE